MQILIIGSKGFIGSNLSAYYSASGNHKVWGCDVLVDYEADNYFLVGQSNADFEDIFSNQKFDVCINCSGAASVPDSLKNPQRDFYLNTLNVFNILESIRKHQPACKFLNLSSAAVYGNPKHLPITENDSCTPLSPYGFHKRNAELICEEFTRFFGLKTCSIRIFSAYGNGLKKQLFWDITKKAASNNSLILYGSGEESRDFIHVDDIVQAIDLIIKRGDFYSEVYNVANGIETTILSAAKLILEAFKWKGQLSFNGEVREGDPKNWCAEVSKLKALGYRQSVQIEKGLADYAEWVRQLN